MIINSASDWSTENVRSYIFYAYRTRMFILGVKYNRTFSEKNARLQAKYDFFFFFFSTLTCFVSLQCSVKTRLIAGRQAPLAKIESFYDDGVVSIVLYTCLHVY